MTLGPRDVGPPAAGQVVEDEDLRGPAVDEQVGDVRADEAQPAGDQRPPAAH